MNNIRFTEEDWQRIDRDWAAWWASESRRPMITANAGRPSTKPEPWWWRHLSLIPREVPAEEIAATFLEHFIERGEWLGDSWPRMSMNFGPAPGGAYMGGEMELASNSVWVHPGKWAGKELREIKPEYDANNANWRRAREVTAACVKCWGRQVQVGFTDIGSPLEIADTLRGTQNLLMDFIDDPEGVDLLNDRITGIWHRLFDEHVALFPADRRGTSGWLALYSPKMMYPLGCDISFMMSPAMFERWAVPFLVGACEKLDHAAYHMDGAGQIPHTDLLLGIPRLRLIQWNGDPKMGSAAGPESWPLLKKIRAGGKLVHFSALGEDVLRMAREVPLDGFAIQIVDRENQAELIAAIRKANADLTKRTVVSGL